MALFDRHDPDDEVVAGADAATRALSAAVVETDFVTGVYGKIASIYDVVFGPVLHPGRVDAIHRMNLQPGDRILEVGIGTGINVPLYPPHCSITGIDLSESMLEIARERIARHGLRHVRLLRMDASAMTLPDGAFDVVYAPYLINVVPDPLGVAREMRRVCRPGGRIIFLNHFRSASPVVSRVERLISPLTVHVGFKADFDLTAFLTQTGLRPISIEKVNIPRIWSLVICEREPGADDGRILES